MHAILFDIQAALNLIPGICKYREPLGVQDPWAEAMAVRGGRLVAVGSDQDVAKLRQDAGRGTVDHDLQGRMVVPVRNDL